MDNDSHHNKHKNGLNNNNNHQNQSSLYHYNTSLLSHSSLTQNEKGLNNLRQKLSECNLLSIINEHRNIRLYDIFDKKLSAKLSK